MKETMEKSIESHVGIEAILFVVEKSNILILIYFLDKINSIMEVFYRENNGNYTGCQVHTCPPRYNRYSSKNEECDVKKMYNKKRKK